MLRREGFSSELSSTSTVIPIDSSDAAGKPDRPPSIVILTWSIGTLQELFSIYPEAKARFRGSIGTAQLNKCIKGADFQVKKERFLIYAYLLKNYADLKAREHRSFRNAVFVNRDKRKTLELLKTFSKGKGLKITPLNEESREEAMWRDSHDYATSISDRSFLSYLNTILATNFLHATAAECEKSAYDCFTTQIDSLVSEISAQIHSIHREEGIKQMQCVKNAEERELETSRATFVQNIADFCRERSRSYAAHSSGVEQVV
jgi:hypothetical protein